MSFERSVEEELRVGYAHLGTGAPADALACFDRALRACTDSAEVRAARADALARLHRPLDAAREYSEAMRLDPACRTYRYERIENLIRGNELANALAEAEAAIAEGMTSARLHVLAARACRGINRPTPGTSGETRRTGSETRETSRTSGCSDLTRRDASLSSRAILDYSRLALEHYQAALDLDPGSRVLLLETASLALEEQRLASGIELLERALRDHPQDGELLFELARAKAVAMETEQARALLLRCLELDDHDPWGAQTLLAEIAWAEQARADGAPLPEGFVRVLFDRYADRYDDELRRTLDYRGPEAMVELLEPFLPRESVHWDVLDLGCGTGLSGAPFRDLAGRLIGVDLSPQMIERARERGIYDDLVVGDLLGVLKENLPHWDLILACDVFAYVGELTEVLVAVARCLHAGGLFAATFEDHGGAGVHLKPTRRFGYASEYLRATTQRAGLELLVLRSIRVRSEMGVPVPSHGLVARKLEGGS